jgi:ribonuclease P protein component
MLPKINRIKKKKEFEAIFKKGARFKNSLFVLLVAKNNLNEVRIGFITSQKVSKKAVIRNKVRRRLSEAVKLYMDKINDGSDLVFIALAASKESNFADLKDAVGSMLNKSKIIKNV